jgi:AraC-like DNA-binding protein
MPETLVEAVTRHTDAKLGPGPFKTAIEGVTLLRLLHEQHHHYLIFKPALCIVVQGAKWAIFGDKRIEYGEGQALVVSIETPAFSRVAEGSPSKPYLGVIIEFDIGVMRETMEMLPLPPQTTREVNSGVFVTDFDGPLADCVMRIIRLLDTPGVIPALYPLIMREIYYRLLSGPHGAEVASIALANSHTKSVIRAIHSLRDHFAQPVRIEELAAMAQMSPSAFHRQFKQITSMTPLQYQKRLRLGEARRLMLTEASSPETAAYQVGYESASQFSREYNRMFGASPRRDVMRMQACSPEG